MSDENLGQRVPWNGQSRLSAWNGDRPSPHRKGPRMHSMSESRRRRCETSSEG